MAFSLNEIKFGQQTTQGVQATAGQTAAAVSASQGIASSGISTPELNPFGQLRPNVQTAEKANRLDFDA